MIPSPRTSRTASPAALLRRLHGREHGTSTLEFSILMPVIFGLIGMAAFASTAVVQAALLDRAAEIVAREVSIPIRGAEDSIQARIDQAIAEAQATTPFITISGVQVSDATDTPIASTPTAGDEFTVSITSTSTNPTAPLTALLVGGDGVGSQLTITRTARGLGQ